MIWKSTEEIYWYPKSSYYLWYWLTVDNKEEAEIALSTWNQSSDWWERNMLFAELTWKEIIFNNGEEWEVDKV